MKMTVTLKNKKKFKFKGEVKTLYKIIELLKTMDHDEQIRTLTYLSSRIRDQGTIADITILDKLK